MDVVHYKLTFIIVRRTQGLVGLQLAAKHTHGLLYIHLERKISSFVLETVVDTTHLICLILFFFL